MNLRIIFTFYCVALIGTQNCVYCFDILEFVKTTPTDISDGCVALFDNIKKTIKSVFLIKDEHVQRPVQIDKYILEDKLKNSFDKYVRITLNANNRAFSILKSVETNPTAIISTPQLAKLHNRKIKSYVISTKDGYLLTIHHLYNETNINSSNNTVLLNHGIMGSSADWILLGPKKSLPYILNDAGYDVWMGNARGNCYSRAHVSKDVNSYDYWKFSFQEMGEFDLPAIIDFIRKQRNGTNEIIYIGHSMGATSLLVLLSTNPSYHKYLRIGILLAPLAFMTNIQGPLNFFTLMSNKPPHQFLEWIGDTEYLPSRKIPKIIGSLCSGAKIYCSNPLFFLTGNMNDNHTLDETFITRLLYHVPAGASTNTILHYGQLVQSGNFHKFGKISSEFPLNNVKLPLILMASSDDWLATVSM